MFMQQNNMRTIFTSWNNPFGQVCVEEVVEKLFKYAYMYLKIRHLAASMYHIRYAREQDDAYDLSEESWSYAAEVTDGDLSGGDEQSLATIDANVRFEVALSANAIGAAGEGEAVKFAVKAEDEAGNASPISNVVKVLVEADRNNGLSGGDIAGIVIGSILGVFLLMVTVYFVATKIGCCGGGADDDEDSYDFADGGAVGGNARRTSIRSTSRRSSRRRPSALEMTDYKAEA